MKLCELLEYKNITIQCHDIPDADAIASGWALYEYLHSMGREVRLIYSGKLKITKPNLLLLIDVLQIPIEYVPDNTQKIEGLLITIDCQYGAKNVTKFMADEVVIIDHHQQEIDNIERIYIAANLGSCSTFVWKLLKEEVFDLSEYPRLQTALYYGLYTDTAQFTAMLNPLDRDMQDELVYDIDLLNRLQNANISVRELEIAGVAMIRTVVNSELRFGVVKAEPCDPNILGLISDMVLQVSEIDNCVVFTVFDYGIKFSVRSCIKEAKANDIASFISKGIGSGGGHLYKAGGFIGMKEYQSEYEGYDLVTYFSNKLTEYRMSYDIINTDEYTFDISDCRKYHKNQLNLGYVKIGEIVPLGEEITVRTLEGDLHIIVDEDTYILIGIKGEIYPIKKEKFMNGYLPMDDKPYDCTLEYHPRAKINTSGKAYDLLEYAKSCISTGKGQIYARRLDRGVKIFTYWDRECYMMGQPGDYIACRADDHSDIYVIENSIFDLSYSPE